MIGALGALRERDRTGNGCVVETSLLDSQLSLACNQWLAWELGGELPERMGSGHVSVVPYQAFAVRDGYVILAALTDQMLVAACRTLRAAASPATTAYKPVWNKVEYGKASPEPGEGSVANSSRYAAPKYP